MTDLRTAAQRALEALGAMNPYPASKEDQRASALAALRAALAEPEGGGNLPPPLQAEPTGKQPLQVEPVAAVAENATTQQRDVEAPPSDYRRGYWDGFNIGKREGRIEAEDAQQQAEPDHETRAELAEQQVVQLAEERDHYRNLWQKAQQDAPLNLADPAVQKRLSTQWGYVPAAQAEPAEPVAALIAQRDALLEALKEVLAWGTDQNYVRAKAACDKARAAIKAVEETK